MISNKKRAILFVILGVILVVASSFSKLVDFLADYNWFNEVGYTSVYLKQVFAKLIVGIPFFIVFSVFIFLYLMGIKKSYYSHMNIVTDKEHEKPMNRIVLLISLLLGSGYSFSISSKFWIEILKFLNSTRFGVDDPLFKRDIGFYVFKLPLINEIFNSLTGFLVFLLVITAVFYFIMISMNPDSEGRKFDKKIEMDIRRFRNIEPTPKKILSLAINQIIVIGIVFFIIVALRSYLAAFNLLYSPRGVAYGASYTDVNVTLWVFRIQMVLSIISAVLIVYAYKKNKLKIALVGPILIMALTIVSSGVETAVQNFIVSPNELAKEKKYIDYNIDYTKKAYALDGIVEKNFAAEQKITAQDILGNEETIKNISINDIRPTKEVYKQIQGIRTYYRFNDIDVDRYLIDGAITQVFIGARELDKENLQSRTWLNEHLKYTHGYGIVMSPVNEITSSGQPKLIVKNIPPVSSAEGIQVKRPEVYFGEMANGYVVVNTTEKEFDYPKGETNAVTEYDGKAGVKLSFLNRLVYSINQGSLKFFVSGGIDSDSKIILNRNIMGRVKKIAPFLDFEQDAYVVLSDSGKLYWIIDGYTYTDQYPYSEPFDRTGRNYMRNSFKVVIDAYDGTTDFYLVDEKDPMINTYSKIFKGLFKPMDSMPEDIRRHIRYPQKYFNIQAQMYQDYHMNNTEVFYNKEDRWQIAREVFENQNEPIQMEPSYITFKLPEEEKAEFLLTVPYTPKQKQNMVSFMVARNDGDKYGQMIIYRLPKNKNIIGPYQVESKIDNEPEISTRLTQWGTGGSKVVRGHLLTIPLENSVLYVEPLYIKSDSADSIPEVKKIIVAYEDQVVMADSLQQGLDMIFGEGQNQIPDTPDGTDGELVSETTADIIAEAAGLYEEAQQALRDANWSLYGEKMEALGEAIKKLEEMEQ